MYYTSQPQRRSIGSCIYRILVNLLSPPSPPPPIASLLDDIVSRVPEGRTMTVASLLAKAFIATAVPDSLCCLEAWHILWGLPRTMCSRYFKGLNMDGIHFERPGHLGESFSYVFLFFLAFSYFFLVVSYLFLFFLVFF